MALKTLTPEQAYRELKDHNRWVVGRDSIYRDYRFPDFQSALDFINNVARIAEEHDHHPNITLHEYCFVRIDSYTHAVNGISERDIRLAKALDDSLGDTQPLPNVRED